jgi:hypothetical protein
MENFISDAKTWLAHSLGAPLLSGGLGISTWLCWLCMRVPTVKELIMLQPSERRLIVFLLCARSAGWLFVGIASAIEELMNKRRGNVQIDIERLYLRTVFQAEPTGLKRIDALEARMKSELSVLIGLVSGMVGALFMANSIDGCSLLIWGASLLALLLSRLARFHHRCIGEIKAELLKGIIEVSPSLSSPPQ